MTIHASPEDMHPDSRLQFFATYLIDGLRKRGVVESKTHHRALLNSEERKLVEEMRAKGLCDFGDYELEAAVLYVAAALGFELNAAKLKKEILH